MPKVFAQYTLHTFQRCAYLCGGIVSTNSLSFRESRCDCLADQKSADVVVIGGGVVGLAVAHSLAMRTNASVVLLEKEASLAAGASSGNSGLGCTGYDSPKGSLERMLLRRSIRLHPNLYRSFGLSGEHINKCGSLIVAWTTNELNKLPEVLVDNQEAGDADAVMLSKEELELLEPSLSKRALGAVFCPREAVAEPWLIPVGYALSAQANGVRIHTSTQVTGAVFDSASKQWTLQLRTNGCDPYNDRGRSSVGEVLVSNRTIATPSINMNGNIGVQNDANIARANTGTGTGSINSEGLAVDILNTTTPPEVLEAPTDSLMKASIVINCAGLYGDEVERMVTTERKLNIVESSLEQHAAVLPLPSAASPPPPPPPPPPTFKITPRKGQFLVFEKSPTQLSGECDTTTGTSGDAVASAAVAPSVIIEPVATDFTKGVIVWSTLYGNVVVGPTATDQLSKTDRSTDMLTLEQLRAHAVRVVPGLAHARVVGSYSGLRPATEHRDYQIYTSSSHCSSSEGSSSSSDSSSTGDSSSSSSDSSSTGDSSNSSSDSRTPSSFSQQPQQQQQQQQPQQQLQPQQWITVGGIRSTGLTASSGIGEYVVTLCAKRLPPALMFDRLACRVSEEQSREFDAFHARNSRLSDVAINTTTRNTGRGDDLLGVTESALTPIPLKEQAVLVRPHSPDTDRITTAITTNTSTAGESRGTGGSATPMNTGDRAPNTDSINNRRPLCRLYKVLPEMPSLKDLSRDYQSSLKSSDPAIRGTVLIHGQRFRVTHPISSFGMEK